MFVEWQNSFMVLVNSAVMLESFGPTHGESSSALKTAPRGVPLFRHITVSFVLFILSKLHGEGTPPKDCLVSMKNEVLPQPGKALQSKVLWLCWHELVCVLDIKFGENRVFSGMFERGAKVLSRAHVQSLQL